MKFSWIHKSIALGLIVLSMAGCSIKYSFSGASISPESKTFSVDYFQNLAPLVVPSLSNTFTEALRDRFMRQTKLDYVQSDGDLAFEGQIVGYAIEPIAITANDQASQNRLTITVKVKFTNKQSPEFNFEKEFRQYKDFPSSSDITSVQATLIEGVTELLVDAIFNASVANW